MFDDDDVREADADAITRAAGGEDSVLAAEGGGVGTAADGGGGVEDQGE